MSIAGIVPRPCGNFDSCPLAVSALKQRGYSILHPERIVGNPEVMAEVALGPDKRRYRRSALPASGAVGIPKGLIRSHRSS
jgi:hypothetical protein